MGLISGGVVSMPHHVGLNQSANDRPVLVALGLLRLDQIVERDDRDRPTIEVDLNSAPPNSRHVGKLGRSSHQVEPKASHVGSAAAKVDRVPPIQKVETEGRNGDQSGIKIGKGAVPNLARLPAPRPARGPSRD